MFLLGMPDSLLQPLESSLWPCIAVSMAQLRGCPLPVSLVPCGRTSKREAYTLEFNGRLGRQIMDSETATGSQQHVPVPSKVVLNFFIPAAL